MPRHLTLLLAAALLACSGCSPESETEETGPEPKPSPTRAAVTGFEVAGLCEALGDDDRVRWFVGAEAAAAQSPTTPLECRRTSRYGYVSLRVERGSDGLATMRQGFYPYNRSCDEVDLPPEWDSGWSCRVPPSPQIGVVLQRLADDSGLVCRAGAIEDEPLVVAAALDVCGMVLERVGLP